MLSDRPLPGFDGLKGNEFAIIGPNVASGLGVTLLYLISTLAERGVSGIGILGEISPEVQSGSPIKKNSPDSTSSAYECECAGDLRSPVDK